MKYILVLLAFALTSASALAEPIDDLKNCIDTKDSKRRLLCFDSVAPVLIAVDKALRENRDTLSKSKDAEAATKEKERDQQVVSGALSALKKMRSQVEAGLSYRTYSQALADVKFGVGTYLDSPLAKKRPDLTDEISSALSHYEFAGIFWDATFGPVNDKNKSFIIASALPPQTVSRYPEMSRHDSQFGIFVAGGLNIIWNKAAESTEKAAKLAAS